MWIDVLILHYTSYFNDNVRNWHNIANSLIPYCQRNVKIYSMLFHLWIQRFQMTWQVYHEWSSYKHWKHFVLQADKLRLSRDLTFLILYLDIYMDRALLSKISISKPCYSRNIRKKYLCRYELLFQD